MKNSRWTLIVVVLGIITSLAAVERGGVRVTAELIDADRLAVTFTPQGFEPWHLYGLQLPEGVSVGKPTTVRVPADSWLRATGPATADQATHPLVIAGMDPVPVFPAGPVTLTLPVAVDTAAATGPTQVLVGYMACTDEQCQMPVQDLPVPVARPRAVASDPPSVAITDASTSSVIERFGVRVATALVAGDRLQVTFTPLGDEAWHLYGLHLPAEALVGQATTVRLPSAGWLRAAGPASADQPTHPLVVADMDPVPVFPAGPVTVTIPVTVDSAAATAPTTILVSYMACNEDQCQRPASDLPIAVLPPGAVPQMEPTAVEAEAVAGSAATASATPASQQSEHAAEALRLLRGEPAPAPIAGPAGLDWFPAHRPEQVRDLLDQAAAAGRMAFLDFTGPSCVNCQVNARTIFPRPAVQEALRTLQRIEINTDPPYQNMAEWQLTTFGTATRPLYVRVDPDGAVAIWSDALTGADVDAFVGFLQGGIGAELQLDDWWQVILLAILGGLLALVMPCTYPMIPLTVNYFVKQAAGGGRLVPLAATYSLGIVVFFVVIGLLVGWLLGGAVQSISGNPWTNLAIALLFLVFGLSLLGAIHLRLPAGAGNVLFRAQGAGGYLGALLMGLTFAITAFTCTAPVAGSLLAAISLDGSWLQPVVGMTIFALVIALPFFALSLSPQVLQKMPRAGSWMEEFKIVGGWVEIAAALKFLAVADNAWGWGLLFRETIYASWLIIALIIVAYLLGLIARQGRQIAFGFGRLSAVVVFLAIAIAMAIGLTGVPLGQVEGWFPGHYG